MYNSKIDECLHWDSKSFYTFQLKKIKYGESSMGRKYCELQFRSLTYPDFAYHERIWGVRMSDDVGVMQAFSTQRLDLLLKLGISRMYMLDDIVGNHYEMRLEPYRNKEYKIAEVKLTK